MGLTDFIKNVKKIFTGDDGEYDDDYRFKNLDDDSSFDNDEYSSEANVDLDDDDESEGLTEAEASRFEKALERFMMKLPEKERESEDVEELIDDVTERYFARKISDPTKALEQGYQQLKATKVQRNEQKAKASSAIIEKLRILESLPEEERYDIEYEMVNEPKSKYYLEKIKKKDVNDLARLLQSWLAPKSINEYTVQKLWLLQEGHLTDDVYKDLCNLIKIPIVGEDDIELTEENYHQQLFFFNNRDNGVLDSIFHIGYDKDIRRESFYEDYADFFKRYWLESGAKPQPIECDDLIVNRPCYLKKPFVLKTPHFHMGKRYFDKDSSQTVMVYLFADKLEYIADRGHYSINLSDIIDISKNAWFGEWNQDEPEVLEITCRDNRKWLFSDGLEIPTKDGDLLVLRAMIYYFIKNPQ